MPSQETILVHNSPEDEVVASPATQTVPSPRYPLSPLFRPSLIYAESSAELCEALIHIVLGWFSFYQAGYLHRDISIRNVFLCPSPVGQPAFEISSDFRQTATKSVEDLTLLLKRLSVEAGSHELSDIENQMMRVERFVQELGVSTSCSAFLIDSDIAAPWATCLGSEPDSRKRSGNPEFMSRGLLRSIELNSKYLQSPVDDLFSVYWVALWAILNNTHTSGRSDAEVRWRTKIAEGRLARADASVDICGLVELEETSYSPIVQEWSPALDSWFQSLDRLDDGWRRQKARLSRGLKPGDSPGGFYLPLSHYFALRGVADFLEMIKPHYTELRNCLPFT
ncbi:hypothetical protein NLJ89_g1433 [Agrocybe chaxingu]|uniref:Fungal-type protein kinase domain-containing protein n=1 Tax=Agrocybe chaxingu TaxID=84603 RepID=A0A9W8N026_9AGAR|nr:hypothetical protein NLJ89_g1433 [Agrocybe chaxingu]